MKDDFLEMLLHAEDMGRLGYAYRPTVKERTGFTQEELNVCPPEFDWQVVADAIDELVEQKGRE